MTVIKKLPVCWQGLFHCSMKTKGSVLNIMNEWYQDQTSSKYGGPLVWQELIQSLMVEEPMCTSHTLIFVTRFSQLPTIQQQHLLAFLLHHRHSIPKSCLQSFTDLIEQTVDKDSWIGILYRMIVSFLKEDKNETSLFDSAYEFSSENSMSVESLKQKLRKTQTKYSPWNISTHLSDAVTQPVQDEQTSEEGTSIDNAGVTSPDIIMVDDSDEPPAKVPRIDTQLFLSEMDQSQLNVTTEDVSHIDIKTEDLDKMRALKEKWETGEDTEVSDEINILLTSSEVVIKKLCAEVGLSHLSEAALSVACNHLIQHGTMMAHGTCTILLSALLLYKVTESFTFLPVDNQWRNDQINILGLTVPHYSTTSNPSTQHNSFPLTDPTKFYKIRADGNCLFSALSFIVTGNQRHYHLFRQKICDFMKDNPDFVESYLPTECNENIRDYLKNSKMETDKVWATEVEILTASMLLKTNIFVYSKSGKQWKWIQYSSVRTTYNNGIYIYHMNEDHFDLVVEVKNSNLMDGLSESNCYSMNSLTKKKNTCEKQKYKTDVTFQTRKRKYSVEQYFHKKTVNPNFLAQKKNLERQRYVSDTDFAAKRKTAVRLRYFNKESYRQQKKHAVIVRYCSNSLYRAALKNISKIKYHSSDTFRTTKKESLKKRYQSSDNYRTAKKESVKKYYHEHEDLRKKKIKSSIKKYHGNEEFRKKVNDSFVKRYHQNEEFRKEKKDSSVRKYHENENFRKTMKDVSIRKYRENENFRKTVKDSSIRKYRENDNFRKTVKDSSVRKYRENEDFRKTVKNYSVKKYRTFDTFKNNLRISTIKKYQSNPLFRAKLKAKLKMVYNLSYGVREKKKAAVKNSRQSIQKAIAKFKKSINDIPSYICTVCIRTLYRSQVKPCKRTKYMSDGELHEMAARCLTGKYIHQCDKTTCICNCKGTRSKEWICHTCDRHLSNEHMPPQAQTNNLTLLAIPEVLKRLNGLERQLIALRIPFMKILSLPRGGQRGVKGPMVNVPTDLNKVTTTLPRTTSEAQFVKVKLKRKLEYKGHYQYEWVNPNNVIEAMRYLIDNNFWYSHIIFNDSWLEDANDPDLIREEAPDTDSENEDDNKEQTNTSSDFPVESCLQPLDLGQEYLDTNDKIFSVAPAENQSPLSIFSEKGIDAMSFPTLLPDGNFGLSADRDIKLSSSKYFNVRLFSADQRFASDNQFIFFAQYVTELTDIISKMSIALRKGKAHSDSGEKVTASMLTDSDNLRNILKSDVGFRFLQPIRGSPPYWQRTMKDLYSMIHQLGIPTWFITFSAAETRWEEVIRTLLNQTSDSRDETEIEWTEKCQLIRENPVTCARLFDHRVKSLFSDLLLSPAQPVGPVSDFFFRTEFQSRGSPHIHCLVWIKGAPKLDDSSDIDICKFVDRYVTCQLPNQEEDPELYNIVTSVQMHSKNHTASCRKHSSTCRFHFPRTPIKKTFIARTESDDQELTNDKKQPPTEKELTEMCRASVRTPKKIIREVWTVISSLESYDNLNIDKVLQMINVTYQQFEDALKAVCTKNTIYCKRKLTDCWVNNYNKDLLRAWNANLDIQYVMDAYSCIAYILSYISKAEAEMGDLLKNAKKEAEEGNNDASATMKKIGQVYVQNREVSAQEAIYRVCSLHLKRCSREITFIPTGSKPLKMSLPINVIKTKQGNDGNIWMTSVIEKYYKRPDNEIFNTMCLADFCSKYNVLPMSKKPKTGKKSLPVYELQQDMGYVKQKKPGKESVIRYPRFNRVKQPEEFYMTMVQLYLPHRSSNIKPEKCHSYEEFVRTAGIIDTINENRKRYELDAEDIEKAWEDLQEGRIREDAWSIIASEAESERLDIELEKVPKDQDTEVEDIPELLISANEQRQRNINSSVEIVRPNITTKQISDMMSQMNNIQEEIFYKVRNWCLKKVWKQNPEPIQLFINGGAGTGKTHLVKCIYYEATRILSKLHNSPDSTPVIMTAPTGTAAFGIEGNTLHSTFSISKTITLPYVPLSENLLNTLRSKFDSLHLIVTDEISMVDHKLLSYVHGRLCQLKQSKKYFGNISIIAVGDFHQLSPVRASPLYKKKESVLLDLWNSVFSVASLIDIMRQKDDVEFAQMLNRIRTYTKEHPLEERDLDMLKSRSYDTVPDEAMNYLHIFPTNKEVNCHNESMVQKLCDPLYTVLAKDFTKDITTGEMRERNTPFSTNSNEDLLSSVSLGINARIMLTRNIDTEDGLVNGAFGTIKALDKNQTGQILAVYIKFDHPKCGKKHLAKRNVRDPVRKNLVKIVRIDETLQGRNVTRRQYPFKLGWAATIHKVQGMTMDNVVVSLKKIFQPCMAYVALSRARSLKGLYIINFDTNVIYASSDVKTAIDNMPPFIEEHNRYRTSDDSVCSILLHNTEGLIPHQHDVKCQKIIQSADIVCFTETWMNSGHTMPKTVLTNHKHHTLSRSDAYDQTNQEYRQLALMDRGGVATFLNKKIVHHKLDQKTTNIECITCIMDSEPKFALSVIYRPPTYPMELFSRNLQKLLTELDQLKIPTMLLGDFNDDISKQSQIKTVFSNYGYEQLVREPTTQSGTTLDNVYVKGFKRQPGVRVIPLYYSFHEAVEIHILV